MLDQAALLALPPYGLARAEKRAFLTAELAALVGVHDFAADSAAERVSFALDREHTAEVMRALADRGVTELNSHPPTLEELFMHEYAGSER